jgi:hypothetical protein
MATLSGTVTFDDYAGHPVKDAVVEVRDESESLAGGDTTGEEGGYKISRLTQATPYTLKVLYEEAVKHEEVINLDAAAVEKNISIAPPPTPTEKDEFDLLGETIKPISIDAPVSIEEAKQLRRLYTVGNYLLAKVPVSITVLKENLGNRDSIIRVLYEDVPEEVRTAIREILEDMSDKNKNEDMAMEKVLSDLREQCDLGTSAVENVNVDFKSIFKEFVTLCNDELLAVLPTEPETNKLYWDAKKVEELHKYWKKLIRVIIKLTRNMSVAGSMGSQDRVLGWAGIIDKSIDILFKVGKQVHSSDQDEKHGWSLLAKLNNLQKSDIKPYLIHAKEGGYMLRYVIDIYKRLEYDRKEHDKKVEDDIDYISTLLHDASVFSLEGTTVSAALRAIATTVLENWPPDWE